ncbi:hypothetical protein PoB_005646900 [Plakobranchus ocellatus]|uniref:Uncharacterized protein n=1 Tax=Plakobranchus ocellatus TaxID=259542 RepID=A0AAV4CFM2_9GAST|nr:hypothetical protein PoB_005646900 [Plakobranchus ocellatus]
MISPCCGLAISEKRPVCRLVLQVPRLDGRSQSQQQGDLRFSSPPSGQGAGGGARTRDRRVPADPRADSLATVPPTPVFKRGSENIEKEEEKDKQRWGRG